MEDLRIRLAKAEGRLAQHDNPHTPSSKKPIGQKKNRTCRLDNGLKVEFGGTADKPETASQRNRAHKRVIL